MIGDMYLISVSLNFKLVGFQLISWFSFKFFRQEKTNSSFHVGCLRDSFSIHACTKLNKTILKL